jgi:hypothetical protein
MGAGANPRLSDNRIVSKAEALGKYGKPYDTAVNSRDEKFVAGTLNRRGQKYVRK